MSPDLALLLRDLEHYEYLDGHASGAWTLTYPAQDNWPHVYFSIAAAARKSSLEHYVLRLDCTGYPSVGPTGTLWDVAGQRRLADAQWPRGTGHVSATLRTDWENGAALYHPFDRRAAQTHGDWPTKHPHLRWNERRTIVDYLSMVHSLLNSSEYHGNG